MIRRPPRSPLFPYPPLSRSLPFRVPPRRRDDGVPQPGFRQPPLERRHDLAIAHAVESGRVRRDAARSEEHTSELQSPCNLVCRLLLEKKKNRSSTAFPPSDT